MLLLCVLATAAFVTATFSGIIGMGGGALLLAVILSTLSHAQSIPVHGAVQLVSNGTRVLAFLPDVRWRTVARFAVGVLPGGALGALFLWRLGTATQSDPGRKALVGIYILAPLALPAPSRRVRDGRWWDWPLLVGSRDSRTETDPVGRPAGLDGGMTRNKTRSREIGGRRPDTIR